MTHTEHRHPVRRHVDCGFPARAGALLLLASVLVVGGCKASPAPSAGFADAALMTHDPSVPFHKFWRRPGVDLSGYTKLYVAEVDTSHMLQMTRWQRGERGDQIEKDAQALGDFARQTIKQAFRDDPSHRFVVLDDPEAGPRVLVFEFALIEVVPSKVTLNALSHAPFGVGTSISVLRALAKDRSSVAFEARATDAATGEVIALAADRETQQQTIVDLRGLTWYSHAHHIIQEWAAQFVQVANQQPGQKIADTPAIRLQPW